jgi:hypothetical protein
MLWNEFPNGERMREDRRYRMPTRVAVAARTEFRAVPSPRTITLLNLVSELVEDSANESELVASVLDLVNRGCVRLIGQVVEPDLLGH